MRNFNKLNLAFLALLAQMSLSATAAAQNTNNAANAGPLPDYYTEKVEPILANRCAVCHGCTDAPCQLKLVSHKAIKRGSSKINLFGIHGNIAPTRMRDANTLAGWRKLNFSPIVPDQPSRNMVADRESSVFYRAITQGLENRPLEFDADVLRPYFDANDNYCPANVLEYEKMSREHSNMGMPLGLPALTLREYQTLVTWLENGAPGPTSATQSKRETPSAPAVVQKWEAFLNRRASKYRLIARYIYEHLETARLHFKESPGEFFEIVRSKTEAPAPISEIVTETAATNPGSGPVYYRLRKIDEIIVKKNHIVWDTDLDELAKIGALFESLPWKLGKEFRQEFTGNPFHDFKAIPAEIRSRFMITHSHLIIDQMVRGSVCIGTGATYAIRDHFWVMFLKPEADPSVQTPGLGMQWLMLRNGPHFEQEISADFSNNTRYQDAFETYLRKIRPAGLGVNDIWTGNGDPNARITVFRHDIIASAHKGWVGGRPLTTWVLSYSNFERLFYNLVVNYRVWGAPLHKVRTWDLMREIRIEGEELFTTLLPETYRWDLRNQWTRSWGRPEMKIHEDRSYGRGSLVKITDQADPVGDLLAQVNQHLGAHRSELDDSLNQPLSPGQRPPNALPALQTADRSRADFEQALRLLTARHDRHYATALPANTYLRLTDEVSGDQHVYSVITNRAFLHHQSPLGSGSRRVPAEEDISIFPGIVGTHANLFVDLKLRDASRFLTDLYNLRAGDFEKFRSTWGLKRSSPDFWPFMDWMTSWAEQADPINGSRLDLSQYDNGRGLEL